MFHNLRDTFGHKQCLVRSRGVREPLESGLRRNVCRSEESRYENQFLTNSAAFKGSSTTEIDEDAVWKHDNWS